MSPRFTVNGTLECVPAWITVEADTPEDALAKAQELPPAYYEYDVSGGYVDFSVTPTIEDAA